MDKYIMAVLTLMPGFLAINTAEKLGKTHTKKTGVSLALAYASYTIVSVLVTMSASLIWLPGGVSMRQAAGGEMPPSFYAALVAVSVATSIISGAAWSLFLSDWILRKCNAINTSRGKNIRWEDGSLFHHLFNDGEAHFLIVRKDGEDIAVGFFDACNDPQDEREELSLVEYPEYREEWQRVKDGEKDSYLYNTVQTYINASNGIIITETEYPPEWLNGDGGKASKEPAVGERVTS